MNTLRLIHFATALERHRNFTRAAEAVGISQPGFTRGIAELERELGVILFDRTRKGIVPTAFGRILLDRGETLLRGENALRREIELLAGLETGLLAVGAGPYAAETFVAKSLARVVSAYPRLQIRCTVADPDQVVQDALAGRSMLALQGLPRRPTYLDL